MPCLNTIRRRKSTVKTFLHMLCYGMLKRPVEDLIRVQNKEEASEIARRNMAGHVCLSNKVYDLVWD